MKDSPSKFWNILPGGVLSLLREVTPSQRWRVIGVFILQTVGNMLELLVLGLLVPLVAMVNDPSIIDRSATLGAIFRLSGAEDSTRFTVLFGVTLLALAALRAAVVFAAAAYHRRFSADLAADVGRRVLISVLHRPWLQQAQTNSSVAIRTAVSEVDIVVNSIIISAILLAAELVTMLVIVLSLVAFRPMVMLPLVLILGGAAYGIYVLKRVRLQDVGKTTLREYQALTKWVYQSLGDVRYTKLVGAERFFADHAGKAWWGYSASNVSGFNIQRTTRVVIESGALATVILLILYFALESANPAAILPTVGMLAVATIRLVPGVAKIVGLSQTLKQYQSATEGLLRSLHGPDHDHAPVDPLPLCRAIELRDLAFIYPGAATPALRGLSLSIACGEMIGVVGPSGAGKSTLIDILCGLIPACSGEMLIDGVDVRPNLVRWQRAIGYVPQAIYLLDDTITANVAFGVREQDIDHQAVRRAVDTASLSDFVDALPAGLDTIVGERGVALSGGQRQRVAIARALYHDPSILILDEATSSLDASTEKAITETLRNIYGQKTIVIIAHRLNTVKGCDRLYLLREGKLVAEGTFDELCRGNRYFREMAALSSLESGEPLALVSG